MFEIFISCKDTDINGQETIDLKVARQVAALLEKNNYKVFLSADSLPKLGASDYQKAINDALDECPILIVVTSCKEYADSRWVRYEWSSFYNEHLSGRKDANIFTVTINMPISELPLTLRNLQCFKHDSELDRLLETVKSILGKRDTSNQTDKKDIMDKELQSGGIELVKMLAEQGNADAQNSLGVCYNEGSGVEQSYIEAFKWFKKSAENNYPGGQYNLALCYTYGRGTIENPIEAFKWFKLSAEAGLKEAQYSLGVCYDNGLGVEEDEKEAFKWFLASANQGYLEAIYQVGYFYFNGKGVEEDVLEAGKWLLKAASQGHGRAQKLVGDMYFKGKGLEQSYQKAVYWYEKAEEQIPGIASMHLGLMYGKGLGVEVDAEKGARYLEKAAERLLKK